MPAAIVTGGAKGIGLAITERLLDDDWDVAVIDMDEEQLSVVVDERPRLKSFAGDVRDAECVEGVVADVVARYQQLDLFVNNAGIAAPLRSSTYEADWRRVLDVNLTGVFLGLRAAGRAMLERGSGSVVSIASIAAERGHVGRSPYAAAKAGVMAFTRVAAAEWAPHGVRANAVAPATSTPRCTASSRLTAGSTRRRC